jgi:hypothetical protein
MALDIYIYVVYRVIYGLLTASQCESILLAPMAPTPVRIPFVRVLALLEEHGWDLKRIKRPFFVFKKRGHEPILVQARDRMVTAHDFERIKRRLAEAQTEDDS